MCVYRVCLFLVLLIIIKGSLVESTATCDTSRVSVKSEGPVGQIGTFSWVGMLRVYLRQNQDPSFKVALTGIVYVKEGYAIANADDVVRIPKKIFLEDSHAMFVPHDSSPWYCRLLDYMTHPDYEADTLSSIALIEMDPGEVNKFPMKPICWPSYAYNASNQLFAVGFTDEGSLLEKFIYKLQYVGKSLCEEFYNRAGLLGGKLAPLHFECGFAQNKTDNCIWDNGIALVSNASGYWKLLGLGLHGPGCAAPARFIDLLTYYPWIEASTNLEEDGRSRKSAFNYGFRHRKKNTGEVENVPAHELLRTFYKQVEGGKHDFAHWYTYKKLDVDELFRIERINGVEIVIHRANRTGQFGDCDNDQNKLIYKDNIEVKAPGPGNLLFGRIPRRGTVKYRLALYDLEYFNYSCVRIKARTGMARDAYLHYATKMGDGDLFAETPRELIRIYPYHPRQKFSLIEPYLKTDQLNSSYKMFHVNLYLKYDFINVGRLDITVFGIERTPQIDVMTPSNRKAFNNLIIEKKPQAQVSVNTKNVENVENNSQLNNKTEVSSGSRPRNALFGLFLILVFL